MRKLVLVVVLVAWFGGSVAQTDVSFADESSTIAAARSVSITLRQPPVEFSVALVLLVA